MKLSKISLKNLVILVFLLGLTSCQSVDMRGQYVSEEAIVQINKSHPNQEEVTNLIGTPNYIPEYNQNTWYYIQRSVTQRAWFNPKVVEQKIVKITFDQYGNSQNAVILDNLQNENVAILGNFTKAQGTEQTGIQKFVKNIGRFNKTTDGKGRKKKKK